MAVCLVYHLLGAPSASQLGLLEVAVSWALKFPRLLVLGDFSIHADTASSQWAVVLVSSRLALGSSQIVSGHTN